MNDIKLIKLLKSMLDDSENGYEENFIKYKIDNGFLWEGKWKKY